MFENYKEIDFVINCFIKWLEIREQEFQKNNKYTLKFPSDAHTFYVDASHSKLLKSLFYGEEPLSNPPEHNHKYGWKKNRDKEKDKKLAFAIYCFKKYFTIINKEGKEFPNSFREFYINIPHSALLIRLLSGLEPLPKPPPKSFSYPWYGLIDNGECEAFEVRKTINKKLIINQILWDILQEISDQEYVVYDNVSKTKCKVTYSYNNKIDKSRKYWVVKVIDDK